MNRKRNKTTVIFVSKNQNSSKPIQVPTAYVVHWKKYILGILGLFLILVGSIFYLIRSNANTELTKNKLQAALLKSKGQLSVIDTSSLKKHYQSIDKKLLTINKYLKARGLKPILTGNEGGEQSDDVLSNEEISEFYDNYLSKITYNVAYTPMGYPHLGTITSGFGHRENPFTGENVETHKGLDIRANYGDPVKCTANGKVIFAGKRGAYGNCIILKHGNGFETYYGHLSKILVEEGENVIAGNNIGKVGSTGRSTGPHLHYEVHQNGKVINPRSFLTL
ncbi:M23 family metallopeptidase [Pedobacter roseus]|uniref:M23 family metallopeptidase n=1 Tax=Pedobacter roseus TaxID=336820 RepID=A0A7G9QGM2_9SPHI|nr:M23 family metallopeptidase [Pedobacter roseus]QNN42497.1 M23 family metallopeptidase [Pedobacter roseus]